jgi:hypothetical protein
MSKPQRPEPALPRAPLTRMQRRRLAQFHAENICAPHTEAEAWKSAASLPDAELVEDVQLHDPNTAATILARGGRTVAPARKARANDVEREAPHEHMGALSDNAFRRVSTAGNRAHATALLAELAAAHIIIRHALTVMTTEQRAAWQRLNASAGIAGTGSTRANEREAVMREARSHARSSTNGTPRARIVARTMRETERGRQECRRRLLHEPRRSVALNMQHMTHRRRPDNRRPKV